MSTISTSIQINDMMSRQFRAMNLAMATVIDSFQTLENVSDGAIDIKSLNAAQHELQEVEAQFRAIEQEIQKADVAQNRLNNEIREGSTVADNFLGKIGAIVGTYLTLQGLGTVLSISDEMANTTARLDLINDGLQTTEQLQQMIFDSAQRSRGAYADTASMIAKLAMNAGDAFGSSEETIAFAELLNKQFVIAGTNVEGIESTILQLTQAMGSGVLRGEELNAVFEATPNIIQSIADYLDVSIGQIRDMASNGEITAEIVKAAMFTAADDINQKFESMPQTWSQVWTTFKNDALWAFQEVLIKLNEIANSEGFKDFAEDAKEGLYTLAEVAIWSLDSMSDMASFIYDNWSFIAPIVGTATAAITLYAIALGVAKVAAMASAFWTGAQTLATGLLTASSWANVQATLALTGAQWGLNAALYSSPIFWVVMAVVLLIGVLYLAVAVVNYFAGTSISATGIIAGAFMFLVAHIYNIIAYLWNIFAAIAEFFVNVWNYPIYSVKKLFYNLASNVLDHTLSMSRGWDSFATGFVNAIIWAVNGAIKAWNWFVDLLPDEIASKVGLETAGTFSARTSITSDIGKIKGYLNDWVGEAPTGYWEAPKMDFKSYSGAWNTGYDWGANLFNFDQGNIQVDDTAEKIRKAMEDAMSGVKDSINDGNAAGKDTAGNTKKLADSADMLEEDLAYLREQVANNLQNLYKNTNIKVDMKNENHIHNDMDIDGVIDRFGEKVEEVSETLAEGDGVV